MLHSLEPISVSSFFYCGQNTDISPIGQFHHPEFILIGDRVTIKEDYCIQSTVQDSLPVPKIIIGDGCRCEQGFTLQAINRIEIKPRVSIGSNVSISDARHEYRQVGLPVLAQGWMDGTGEVIIGEGTQIGDGTVISGNVRIGKHCVIQPGSLVEQDLPDYCVAGGSPAQILQQELPIPEQETTGWSQESGTPESTPLLSICIPTYNRAANLDQCLSSIFSQLQDDNQVEVIVCDNASTDATPQVIARYASRYPCLRSFRNSLNVGADRNIYLVAQLAKGKFIKWHGDDDYFVENSIPTLLDVIQHHMHCGIIYLNVHNHDGQVYTAEGASDYLRTSGIMSTFISGIILRRKDFEQIKEPFRYIDSSLNQAYLQYEILTTNPTFCVVNRRIFNFAGNPPAGYNLGEVVFRNYQSILRHFIGKGLTEEDIGQEKEASLYNYILPWYSEIMNEHAPVVINDFEDIFREFYSEESYFEDILQWIGYVKALAQ
ncbi:glycosyltransferase [Paenibacillus sp. FSL R7-0204]|uniref:glycosyltransferase n=1 Tax=Paenibacillus sp. FSL R7-0204 TaxID=2921675 RepID=UPI0030FB70F3